MTQARDAAGQFVSRFDPETFEEVCRRIEHGEFTAPILRELGIPERSWYDWLKDEERATRYGQAKSRGEECIIADCISIADDGRRDYKVDDDGREVVDHDHIARSKLRIDTRLKALAKYNPKRWGDKVEHSGKIAVSHEDFLAKLPDPAAE